MTAALQSIGRWPLWKKIVVGIASFIGVAVVSLGAWLLLLLNGLPSASELANYEPPITSRVHAGDGRLVAEFASQHRVYVPSEEIPQKLVYAFISAEDKTFFEHHGIDWWGMLRGTVGNAIQGKRMTGGSTITQQVVKNMLVGSERAIDRKIREAILAGRMEEQFSKEEILELYMNEIYLGGRSYGVGAASLDYFGKSLSQLSLAECASLAALPQAPGKNNPYNNPEAAKSRRNWVLDRMVINGYVEKAEAEKAKAEPLKTIDRLDTDEIHASAYFVEQVRREILGLGKDHKLEGLANEKEAEKAFLEGGLSIRSTLDTNLQLVAQTALRAGLETYDRRHGWRGPVAKIDNIGDVAEQIKELANSADVKKKIAGENSNWQLAVVKSVKGDQVKLGLDDGKDGTLAPEDAKWAQGYKREKNKGVLVGDVFLVSKAPTPEVVSQTILEYGVRKRYPDNAAYHIRQIPLVEGALVAIDPHTGRVLAMAGGYSFARSQFNRAMQAMRQPGSTFKPFVYAAALENGWTPASRVLDAPYIDCSIQTKDNNCYTPENYEKDYYGLATLRLGIERSRNTMTVRLATDIGLDKVSEMGVRMGIYDKLPPYTAMALGAGETTPMRMVSAYAELVNGGKKVTPVLLDRIQNRYGETVFKRDARACDGCSAKWENGLQPPVLANTSQQVMDPVTAYQMVSILEGVVQHGTLGKMKSIGKPMGAKTGTTNDFGNAWTMGVTPDLAVGVWVGFDTPKTMGEGEAGSKLAAPIWRDFMLMALKDAPAIPFRVPPGVTFETINADSGCLPFNNGGDRLLIQEAFKEGTAPTATCPVGSTGEGYTIPTVDFGKIIAGDEPPETAPVDPNAPIVPTDPGVVVDPNAPQPAQPTQKPEDLNLKEGVY